MNAPQQKKERDNKRAFRIAALTVIIVFLGVLAFNVMAPDPDELVQPSPETPASGPAAPEMPSVPAQ